MESRNPWVAEEHDPPPFYSLVPCGPFAGTVPDSREV